MKISAFLVLILLMLAGCITDTGEQLPNLGPASVDSIICIGMEGRTVSFTVQCTVPTPCYIFVRSEYSISGQSISVTVYVRPRNNEPCYEVLSSLEASASVVVPSAGTYTFQFWRWGGQTLDTTLTFQ